MKLSDYIQYYIGCEVIIDDKERGLLIGADLVPNSCNQIYYQIQTDKMRIEDGEDFCMPYSDDPDEPVARIKPILRQLEDITDEEWSHIEEDVEIISGLDYLQKSLRNNFLKEGDVKERFGWSISNLAVHVLRKRGVDMDGLIENSLAVDAKTLIP